MEATSETGYYGGGPGMMEAKSRFDDAPAFASSYTSPGWKRAQERSGFTPSNAPSDRFGMSRARGRNAVIEGEGRLVATSDPSAAGSDYSCGDKVFHQKFGPGHVVGVEGNKLTVEFSKAGEKKVLDSFVERA